MKPFWITFQNGTAGCIMAWSVPDAVYAAEAYTGQTYATCQPLPQAAEPRLGPYDRMQVPSYCKSPQKCAGCVSCPHLTRCTFELEEP